MAVHRQPFQKQTSAFQMSGPVLHHMARMVSNGTMGTYDFTGTGIIQNIQYIEH